LENKSFKYKSELFQQEVTVTIDEELNKLMGKVLARRKLEEANKALRDFKDSLPK
jgi:hypothetical protein